MAFNYSESCLASDIFLYFIPVLLAPYIVNLNIKIYSLPTLLEAKFSFCFEADNFLYSSFKWRMTTFLLEVGKSGWCELENYFC